MSLSGSYGDSYGDSYSSTSSSRTSSRSSRSCSRFHISRRLELPWSYDFSSSGSGSYGRTGISSTWSSCYESSVGSSSSDSTCSRDYLHTHMDYINNFQSTRQKNFRFTDSRQKMQSRNALRYINRPLNCNRLHGKNVSGLNKLNESRYEQRSPIRISLAHLALRGPSEKKSDISKSADDSSTRKNCKIQCESSGSETGSRSNDSGEVQKEEESLGALKYAQDSWGVAKSDHSSLSSLTSTLQKRLKAIRGVVLCIES